MGRTLTAVEPGTALDALLRTPAETLLEELLSHGVLLFRGFAATHDSFVAVSSHVASRYLTHSIPRMRESRSADQTVVSVVAGQDAIPLHGEMFYSPVRPDVLWLMCNRPAATGGQTTVCNGEHLLESLSPTTRKLFEEKDVLYRRVLTPETWATMGASGPSDVITTVKAHETNTSNFTVLDDGSVAFDFVCSAVSTSRRGGRRAFINSLVISWQLAPERAPTWADGSPIPEDVFKELDAVGERIADGVQWQAGDVVCVDNSWILHGRRAFSGPRDIVTRFGMFAS
jgi:alpha-ketoglutarate-dependent taurine dioxygenase